MRVSREKAAENRERIVAEASRLFREHGFDAIGVDALMKAVGLTHGGFYGHFKSKDDLIAEAVGRGLADSAPTQAAHASLQAFLESYLSPRHREDVRDGCLVGAIACDVARQDRPVRHTLSAHLSRWIDGIARLVLGRDTAARRRAAIAAISGAVGALVLSRAVDDAALSDEILAAARTALGEAFGPRDTSTS